MVFTPSSVLTFPGGQKRFREAETFPGGQKQSGKGTYIWNFLNGLSVEDKMEVISRLSHSVSVTLSSKNEEDTKSDPLSSSFGIWRDDKKYPTDALINDISVMACDNDDLINELLKL